jgi:amidase
MRDVARLDACGQAELLSRGEVRAGELAEAAIRRCERERALGVLVAECFEEGLRAARGLALPGDSPHKQPLHGVPFLMKDVGAAQQGQPYFAGNRALRELGYRAREDSLLGRRFREAGLVTLGVSKAPEFGMQSTTQPLAFGPARNPWDPSRSSGGSSGGACAAVAAGLVPLAHANDGAGSIRIPAAWCGVVGLKPSRGWLGGTARASSSAEFVVARSLRDVAAALDVLGEGVGSAHRAQLARSPGRLRVGFLAEFPGIATQPECAKAAEQTAALLASLGHEVSGEWPQALADEERGLRGLALFPLGYRACLGWLAALLGRAVTREDVEPFLWEFADPEGPTPAADDVRGALEWLARWAGRVASWWDEFDLLVTPTVSELPVPLSDLDPALHGPQELLQRMSPHMAFTAPFNQTGQPALSLPLCWTAQGLPIGVQLVARHGRDDLLLQVAAQLEAARPWAQRVPVGFGAE